MKTLNDLVFRIREVSGGRPDLLSITRRGKPVPTSTSEFLNGVHSLALALESRGTKKGDRVAIFAENRPEWHIVDLACHLLGAVSVPLYPTLSRDQVAYILKNSGSSWVFATGADKISGIEEIRSGLPKPLVTVGFDDEPADISLTVLSGEGAPQRSALPLETFRGRVGANDLASLIYTSGTTGDPKGVVLSHHNFVSNVLACQQIFDLGPTDQALSFLPLSHVFERTVDYLFFFLGVRIHYSPSVERVAQLLPIVRPTVLTSVPRVYERAYLRVVSNVAKEKPSRQRIFRWGVRVGHRYARARLDRFVGPWLTLQRWIADRLVYRKVKVRFGGRLRFAIAGGAPLGLEVAEFFDAVGLNLYQGYGLTETSPVLAANSQKHNRRGSVGKAIPGVELRIAADGEILARSPGIMLGYWENPEATAETIGADGWLRTGDVGYLDEDGFLFITDRKKDLLITSGGKNVAPAPIEQHLVAHWAISQAIVFGDRYPYLTALVVPRFEDLPESLQGVEPEELVNHPELLAILEVAIDEVNDRLGEHERLRRFRVLPRELSIEAGEITPTLKVRRRVVAERYAELVSSMYLKTQKTDQAANSS